MATVADRARLLEHEPFLGLLRNCLAEAEAGRGRLVLVAGEAGSGKTALVRALHLPGFEPRGAERADLPVDDIVPVANTVLVRPDPVPATA